MQVKITNITKCFIIKRLTSHYMMKLSTGDVIFYPSKFIKELDDKTLELTFFPNMQFKANKSKQENGKLVRYDHKTLDSADLILIIMENDQGAKKC